MRWMNRERVPDQMDMPNVFVATDGAVEPNDFYDLPPLPEGAAEPDAAQEAA